MSGITEPPYAYARAFLMVSASAAPKRALSIGAMTSSQAVSTSDSWARTEYDDAGRAKTSAPAKTRAATAAKRSRGRLDCGVLRERDRRVSRMRSCILREMLCNHSAARRFALGMARKAKQPPAVLQRD